MWIAFWILMDIGLNTIDMARYRHRWGEGCKTVKLFSLACQRGIKIGLRQKPRTVACDKLLIIWLSKAFRLYSPSHPHFGSFVGS
jgi:hypothetical protein